MKPATKKRSNGPPATTRVAIYCRQSVDRGEEGEFGSLEAQREAVEAYVSSQRAQGWAPLPDSYDDGGYSGANTERPAFQRLLADIESGQVDVVAVYRLDRLSRSLLDFAQLMQIFEQRGVAFVSVTEHFDTSTPMGRMVLNLLATFAQFERETIAQRTRDKMLASRRRGLWTGGRPILGYDIVEKRLVVNEAEAAQVREAFRLYEELGSILAVAQELTSRGWRTKTWTNLAGNTVRGQRFTKSSAHTLLTNPIYAGRIRAGDEVVDGTHDAIVEPETWDRVQSLLASNRGVAGRRPVPKGTSLLQGIARCACGSALTTSYTRKGQRRHGYYVCARAQKEGASACPGSRVAMGDLDAFVVDRLRAIGRDPEVLHATADADHAQREALKPELVAQSRRLASEKARHEGERRNLLDAIAGSNGGTATPVLMRRLEETDAALTDAARRAREVATDLQALELDRLDPDELRAAFADLEPVWAELFPKERARVLGLLVEEVVFDAKAEQVEITFRPGGPRALGGRS